MRVIAWALLLLCTFAVTAGREPASRIIAVSTADELMAALGAPLDNVTVQLSPGDYVIPATPGTDRVPGCDGNTHTIRITTGLKITGNKVRLVGPREGQAMIVTDAGYKIFFKDCRDCALERIKVMAPPREEEHASHDAVVVATHSTVRIANCWLITEIPPLSVPPTGLPGGDGIRGGDGANLLIEFNEITCFTWGIVLQKGSHAVIRNNLLEGAPSMRKRGAILVQCDADVRAERNLIRGFPRGVEVWDTLAFVLRENILEDVTGDGIFVAAPRAARVTIEQNAMYRCGTLGMEVEAGSNARVARNLIVDTGIVDGASNGVRASPEVTVRNNTVYNDGGAGSREVFWRARKKWTRTYRNTAVGVDGRHKFHESAFLTRYGRWAD